MDKGAKDPKVGTIERFFDAYAASDMEGLADALDADVEWASPGHHPLSGTKRGIAEVRSFFDHLGEAGFKAEPIFLGCSDEYVVDVHRGFTTKGVGKVDTMWALVWHFNADGRVDRVVNLSGDQHQMDAYIWANFDLAPLPQRLATMHDDHI